MATPEETPHQITKGQAASQPLSPEYGDALSRWHGLLARLAQPSAVEGEQAD